MWVAPDKQSELLSTRLKEEGEEEEEEEREGEERAEREVEVGEEEEEEGKSFSDDDDEEEGLGYELEILSAQHSWLAIHKKPWMFRLLGCLACRSGFRQPKRRKSACGVVGGARESFTASDPAVALAPLPLVDCDFNALLHSSCSFCCCMMPRMKDKCSHVLAKKKGGAIALRSQFGQIDAEVGCLSTRLDGLSSNLGDMEGEDVASCSDSSSPFSWSKLRSEDSHSATCSRPSNSMASSEGGILWEDTKHEMWSTSLPEVEMIKERFVKLLLGEDMSGSGNGVCSALALSNAITNLSASVFGEIWRLEPLPDEKKKMWHREMEWLLAITDHIREFIPSSQTLPNGTVHEVMVSRPRADLYVNLPALQKLDAMLLETLDKFRETEFWYVEQGLDNSDENGRASVSLPRQEEKWWLPSPKLPPNGLSSSARKHLLQQHECVSQILKAALAINSQILFEMDIPQAYLEALPKNGKAIVGETIYKHITSERFSPEALLGLLDLSNEHRALDIANRIEAAIHIWGGQKQLVRDVGGLNSKATWDLVKDLIGDVSKRETLASRADNLLLCLKRKFPSLPQTLLDITKIQYNRDVGRSILESYSRVTETLASNILARIDDILFADDMLKGDPSPPKLVSNNKMAIMASIEFSPCTNTPYGTPVASPASSPTRSMPLNDAHIYELLHKNIVDNKGLALSPSLLINAQRVLQ